MLESGAEEVISLHKDDHPGGCVLLPFPFPRILQGLPEQNDPESWASRPWKYGRHIGPPVKELKAKYGGLGFVEGEYNMFHYAQMLAKIGHAYAVTLVDIHGFYPFCLDFILGRTENYGHYVGGDLDCPPAEPGRLHIISANIDPKNDLMTVNIRLFANIGAPQYYVVVGKIKKHILEYIKSNALVR